MTDAESKGAAAPPGKTRNRRPSLRVPIDDEGRISSPGGVSLGDVGVTAVAAAAVVVVRGATRPDEPGDFSGGSSPSGDAFASGTRTDSYYDAVTVVEEPPEGLLDVARSPSLEPEPYPKPPPSQEAREHAASTVRVSDPPAVPGGSEAEVDVKAGLDDDDDVGAMFSAEAPLLGTDPGQGSAPERIDTGEVEAGEVDVDLEEAPPSMPAPAPPSNGVSAGAEARPSEPTKRAAPPPPVPRDAPPPPPKREIHAPAAATIPESGQPGGRRAWFETFFDEDYLRMARPPTDAQVARQCDFIESQLGLAPGATVLDVGAGLGLQAGELARRGYKVTALDLSSTMQRRTKLRAGELGVDVTCVRGDMRSMQFETKFDAILCWGTTFGYFEDDVNRRVIDLFFQALKPLGVLLVDVVNRDHLTSGQPNLLWFEGDGCVCIEETGFNYITSRLLVKRTVIRDDGHQYEHFYSVRVYSLHELGQLMHGRGFRVVRVSGREATPGVFFGPDSPRLIMLAERRPPDTATHPKAAVRDSGRPTRNELPPIPSKKPSSVPPPPPPTIPDPEKKSE